MEPGCSSAFHLPVTDADTPEAAVILTLSGACGVRINRLQLGQSGRDHDFAVPPEASGGVMATGIITVQPAETAIFKRGEETRIK